MPDPDMQLLAHAERQVPSDPGVRDCWGFVVEGIRLGWLSSAKIQKLIGHLREHEDYGLDELIFEQRDDLLHVSLLDDHAECASASMIKELELLLSW